MPQSRSRTPASVGAVLSFAMSRAVLVPAASTSGRMAMARGGRVLASDISGFRFVVKGRISAASVAESYAQGRRTACMGARFRTGTARVTGAQTTTRALPPENQPGTTGKEPGEGSEDVSAPDEGDETESNDASSPVKEFSWDDIGPGLLPSVATACLGAFLFGYHSAVINAPLSAIADDLGFAGDNVAKGAVVSVLVAGGFLGGLGIGPLADQQGRRAALAATTIPLTIGTLISAGADSFTTMMVGRLITGIGVGASSQIVPLYLSEVSPPNLRGTVNGIRRVAYVVGCLLAFQFAVPLQKPPVDVTEQTQVEGTVPEKVSVTENVKTAKETPSVDSSEKNKQNEPRPVVVPEPMSKQSGPTSPTPPAPTPTEVLNASSQVAPDIVVSLSKQASELNKAKEGTGDKNVSAIEVIEEKKTTSETAATPKAVSATQKVVSKVSETTPVAPSVTSPPQVSNWTPSLDEKKDTSSTVRDFLKSYGGDAEKPIAKDPLATAPGPLKSTLEYPKVSVKAVDTKDTKTDTVASAKIEISFEGKASANEATSKVVGAKKDGETTAVEATAATVKDPKDVAPVTPVIKENTPAVPTPSSTAPATSPSVEKKPSVQNSVTDKPVDKPITSEKLVEKASARLEEKPIRLSPAETKNPKKSTTKAAANGSTNSKKNSNTTPSASPGWWRPLFYWAAAPAGLLAVSTVAGIAVESPVWLLGPEGCAVESRRSLAKLLNLRGRAAVRWQESVSGAVGRIAVGKARAGRVMRTSDEDDDSSEDSSCALSSDENLQQAEPAVNSWSVLFTDQRNRQPVIIGLGLCFLAAFSGSNTVIYFASSVLREAGLTDPGLLTTAVGVPNLLGGLIALAATDTYGRRPLLLISFGGMSVSLAALAIASAITPGVATDSFCQLPIQSSPGEFSGLPCVTCDVLAAICDDLPTPTYDGGFGIDTSREPQRTVALIAIPAYTLLFSLGAGPVPWLLYNEVFPTRIRARATAVCTAINYAANTVVGASFLPLVSGIGLGGTYGLYALSCASGYLFVNRFVFETKGLKLEDIEGVMAKREIEWTKEEDEKKLDSEGLDTK